MGRAHAHLTNPEPASSPSQVKKQLQCVSSPQCVVGGRSHSGPFVAKKHPASQPYRSLHQRLPARQRLQRRVFSPPQRPIQLRRLARAVFGTLPKLAFITAQKRGFILLALVT